MKNTMKYILLALVVISFTSCEKLYDGGEVTIDNTLAPYIEMVEAGEVIEMDDTTSGKVLSLTAEVRENRNYPIIYEYSFTDNLSLAVIDTIEVGTLEKTTNIPIPDNLLGTDSMKTYDISLSNARCNGQEYTIGRNADQTLQLIIK